MEIVFDRIVKYTAYSVLVVLGDERAYIPLSKIRNPEDFEIDGVLDLPDLLVLEGYEV